MRVASLAETFCPRARARVGRPKDAAKRVAIVEAARDLFFARGIEATTIEDVAARAGVSKVTVYGHFGDKLTLFQAAVRHEMAFMEQGLIGADPKGSTLPECLHAFGTTLLRFLTSPKLVAFDRMLSGEASRHPELARRFFEAGPDYFFEKLSRMIAAGHERGEVDAPDPSQASEDLVGLWYGMLHKKLAMGRIPSPAANEIDVRVRHGIALFMRAYAPS